MSLTCSTWWASPGLLNTRDLMSSLKFPIKDDQIGKCPPLAYFSLFAPVTTETISKPPLLSHLAVTTSLISRPLLFRLFSLLTGQTNRMYWRGGRKGRRGNKPKSSFANWWCLEINWFGIIAKVQRNILPTASFKKKKKAGTIPLKFSKYMIIITITSTFMNLLGNTPMHSFCFLFLLR